MDHRGFRSRFAGSSSLLLYVLAYVFSVAASSLGLASENADPGDHRESSEGDAAATDSTVDESSGSARYLIPVEVLPGPRGFQPSLALRYTSSTEDGTFGMGWSFPTGEVRCASRFGAPDANPSPGQDACARFELDGQLLVEGPGGAGFREFRTSVESFQRIRFYTSGSDTGTWESVTTDGTVSRYGEQLGKGPTRVSGVAPGSGDVVWKLTTQQDTFGNTIHYEYTDGAPANSGTLFPTWITYADSTRRVGIIYETRPDPIRDFRGGVRREIVLRAKEIFVDAGEGKTVSRLRLRYTPASGEQIYANNRTRLLGVTRVGADCPSVGACNNTLPEQTFQYTQNDLTQEGSQWSPLMQGGALFLDQSGSPIQGPRVYHMNFADVNGDGMQDIVEAICSSNEWPCVSAWAGSRRVWLKHGAGWQVDQAWTDALTSTAMLVDYPTISLQYTSASWLDMDLDESGTMSLPTHAWTGSHQQITGDIQKEVRHSVCGATTGRIQSGFSIESFAGANDTLDSKNTLHPDMSWKIVDLNGDGLSDFVMSATAGGVWVTHYCDGRERAAHLYIEGDSIRMAFLNTGSGWEAAPSGFLNALPDFTTLFVSGDAGYNFSNHFDNWIDDGVTKPEDGSFGWFSQYSIPITAGCSGFGLSTGGGRFQSTRDEAGPCYASISWDPQFSDLNGDGLLDVIVLVPDDRRKLPYNGRIGDIQHGLGRHDLGVNPTRSKAFVQRMDGSGFEPAPLWDLPFPHVGLNACLHASNRCGSGPSPVDHGVRMVDLNSDGLTDVIWTDPGLIFPDALMPERRTAAPLTPKGVLMNTGSGWCSSATLDSSSPPRVVAGPCATDGIRYAIPEGFEFALRGCVRHLWFQPSQCSVPRLLQWARDVSEAYIDGITRPLNLIDVNGDGFLDLVLAEHYLAEDGSDYTEARTWIFDPEAASGWSSEDPEYALPIYLARGVQMKPALAGAGAWQIPLVTKWLDLNNDGISDIIADPDFFQFVPGFGGTAPAWVTSNTSLPELLEKVDSGQGGEVEFSYTTGMLARVQSEPCVGSAVESNIECIAAAHAISLFEELPNDRSIVDRWTRNPVVASLKRTALNQSDSPATLFSYAHPRWSRTEKTSLGFRLVARTHPDGSYEEKLFSQEHGSAGRISRRGIYADDSRTNALRCEVTNYQRVVSAIPGSIPGVYNRRPSYRTASNVYGGGRCGEAGLKTGAPEVTQWHYDDDYGFNFAETIVRISSSRGLTREVRTPYEPNTAYWLDRWIVGNVGEVVLQGATASDLVSRRTFTYGTHGQVTRTETQITARGVLSPAANEWAVIRIAYDRYGNISRSVDPDDRVTEYCYDGDTLGESGWTCGSSGGNSHSIRVATRDNLSQRSSYSVLDPIHQKPSETHSDYTDVPSRLMNLDAFGRVISVSLRPNDLSAEVQIASTTHWDNAIPPYREDFAYPNGVGGDVIRTATISNGFGSTWKIVEDVAPRSGQSVVRYRGKAIWIDSGDRDSGRPRSTRSTYQLSCGTDPLCGSLQGDTEPLASVAYLDGLGRVERLDTLDGVTVNSYRDGMRSTWVNGDPTARSLDVILTKDARGNLTRRGLDGAKLVFSEECANTLSPNAVSAAGEYCAMIERTFYDYTSDGLVDTVYDAAIASSGANLDDISHRIRYQYDTRGRLLKIEDPDAGETNNTYTRSGQIESTTNSRLQLQTYAYDAIGRLETIVKNTPGEQDISLTYRSGERQTGAEYARGYSKAFDYDEFGRLERETRVQRGTTFLVDTKLDQLGRLRFVNYPVDDMLIMYEYEGAYLREVCEIFDEADPNCAAKNKYYIKDVEYDELGRRTLVDYGASERSFRYDNRYYLSEQKVNQTGGNASYEWIYTASLYDEIGNLKNARIDETIGFGTEIDATMDYTYDTQNRLASWSHNGTLKSFGYDACGNLTDHEGDPQHYNHASHAHAVSERVGAVELYSYDTSGNVSSITGGGNDRYFKFDSSNQLTCQGSSIGACDVMWLRYDAAGQRVELGEYDPYPTNTWKIFIGPNIRFTKVIAGMVSARLSVSAFGEEVAYRYFDGRIRLRTDVPPAFSLDPKDVLGGLLALLSVGLAYHAVSLGVRVPVRKRPLGVATVGAVVLVVVFPLAAVAGGGGGAGRPIDYRRWIVSSSLGSGVLELSEIGDRIQAKIFRPFGEEATAVGVATYFGTKYAGHRKEKNSNLYYMNARWMDAAAGRFVSVDPLVASIVRPQSLNGYSYVENNPISGIDPTGRSPDWNPRHWLLVYNPESSSKVSAADAENDGGGGASSGSGSPGVGAGVGTPTSPGTAAPAESGNPVGGASPAPQGGKDPWQGVEVFPTVYPDSHRKFVAAQHRMDATMGRMRASLSNGPSVGPASGGFVGGPGVYSAPPAPTSSVDIAGVALARAGAAAFTGPADPLMLGVIGGAFVLQGLVFGGLAVGTAVVGAPIIAGTTALGLGILGAAFVVSGAIDIALAIRVSGAGR